MDPWEDDDRSLCSGLCHWDPTRPGRWESRRLSHPIKKKLNIWVDNQRGKSDVSLTKQSECPGILLKLRGRVILRFPMMQKLIV